MTSLNPTHKVLLNLSPALAERTKQVAKANGRTLTAEIRFALKRNNRNPITKEREEMAEFDIPSPIFILDELRPDWAKHLKPNSVKLDYTAVKKLLNDKYGVTWEDFDTHVGNLLVELTDATISD